MHHEVSEFIIKVREQYPEYFVKSKVLEVGSLDINGSIRSLFIACDYTGLDIGPGPGVDIVCPIHKFNPSRIEGDSISAEMLLADLSTNELPKPFPHYDTVVSTEMLEHDVYWQESLQRMYDLTKPGGIFILTCAGPNRHEHGTKRTTPQDSPFTTDYYRNISAQDFESVLSRDLFKDYSLGLYRGDCDLYFYGIKK